MRPVGERLMLVKASWDVIINFASELTGAAGEKEVP